MFLKVYHPLPSSINSGALPKELVSDNALIPFVLHLSLYPGQNKSSSSIKTNKSNSLLEIIFKII